MAKTASPRLGAIPKESTQEGEPEGKEKNHAGEDADSASEEIDTAVDLIWQKVSAASRKRSTKGDLRAKLKAALKRGHSMERLLKGVAAYVGSQEGSKEEGAYQRGAHRIFENDFFESFLEDDGARASRGQEAASQELAEEVGSLEEPSASLQALWMDLYSKGMPWPTQRGPQPGRLGCRVSDEI